MSAKARTITGLIVAALAWLALMFAIQVRIGHAYGIGWELALTPVEIAGCLGMGVLIGKALIR